MRKILFISCGVILGLVGCADKPMATSVAELSHNKVIVGWKDYNKTRESKAVTIKTVCKPKVIVKKVYITKKIKEKIKDSDGDGVIDKFDKCPNTPKDLLVNHEGCPLITTLRFNFDFNSAKIKKIYYPQIKKVAEVLKANPKLKIEIAGYTDNIGDKEYNRILSLKRAEAVRNILVNKYHISSKRIIVKGFGEEYPLVPNTTSTNRALNRRVEIVDITYSKEMLKRQTNDLKVKSLNTSLNKIFKENKSSSKINSNNKSKANIKTKSNIKESQTKKEIKKEENKKKSTKAKQLIDVKKKSKNINKQDTNMTK